MKAENGILSRFPISFSLGAPVRVTNVRSVIVSSCKSLIALCLFLWSTRNKLVSPDKDESPRLEKRSSPRTSSVIRNDGVRDGSWETLKPKKERKSDLNVIFFVISHQAQELGQPWGVWPNCKLWSPISRRKSGRMKRILWGYLCPLNIDMKTVNIL